MADRWYRPWSHSRMTKADKCPFAFADEKRDGYADPSNPLSRIGRATHEVIAQYTLHCQSLKVETDIEYIKTLLIENRHGLADAFEKSQVARLVSCYADSHRVNPLMKVEHKFAFDDQDNPCDWDSPDALWRGIIDNWYKSDIEEITIIDYFTGWKQPAIEVKYEQMKKYACALALLYPDIEVFSCFAEFLRFNQTVDCQFTRDEALQALEEIRATDHRWATMTDIEPAPGEYCDWCTCWRRCPKMRDALAGLPEPAEDAETWLLLKAAIKKIEPRLKAHCESNGPINVKGQILGFHQTASESYDFKSIVSRAMRKAQNSGDGDTVKDALFSAAGTISTTSMKSFVKQVNKSGVLPKPLELADFADAKVVKSGTRFEFRSTEKAGIDAMEILG